MSQDKAYKVGGALKGGGGLKAYQALVLGSGSWWYLIKFELIMLIAQNTPGSLGIVLRKKLYPMLLGRCGPGCLFGKGVTLRHPKKIRLGEGVVVDDHAMLDAKGEGNAGLILDDGVYIGRNTIVYTKGGDIELAAKVNVSHNCELFSSNLLKIGRGSFIAAYSYILSGGEYEMDSKVPLSEQPGTKSRGATILGENVWIAAHVVVADGSVIGDHAVVGAGAVVRGEVPPNSLAAGVPARLVRGLDREPS
jgi:acetyltransferase-like isoleucine patch superfamily enzyme